MFLIITLAGHEVPISCPVYGIWMYSFVSVNVRIQFDTVHLSLQDDKHVILIFVAGALTKDMLALISACY